MRSDLLPIAKLVLTGWHLAGPQTRQCKEGDCLERSTLQLSSLPQLSISGVARPKIFFGQNTSF